MTPGGKLTTVGSPYDIQYGLSRALIHAAQKGDKDFLIELGGFLNAYRLENTLVLDRMHRSALANRLEGIPPTQRTRLRPSHTTADVEQLVDLTYGFHAPLVCSLLIAYAYARVETDTATIDETASTQADIHDDDSEDQDL